MADGGRLLSLTLLDGDLAGDLDVSTLFDIVTFPVNHEIGFEKNRMENPCTVTSGVVSLPLLLLAPDFKLLFEGVTGSPPLRYDLFEGRNRGGKGMVIVTALWNLRRRGSIEMMGLTLPPWTMISSTSSSSIL